MQRGVACCAEESIQFMCNTMLSVPTKNPDLWHSVKFDALKWSCHNITNVSQCVERDLKLAASCAFLAIIQGQVEGVIMSCARHVCLRIFAFADPWATKRYRFRRSATYSTIQDTHGVKSSGMPKSPVDVQNSVQVLWWQNVQIVFNKMFRA